MAKITFQMIVFQDDYFLEYALKTALRIGDVVVTEGPVKYWADRGYTTSTDRTNEILEDLLPPENVVHGVWSEKDEMVNASIHLVPDDTTHIWVLDADEIYKTEELRFVIEWLDTWDSVSFMPYSFYGGFDRYMTGFEENFEIHRIQRYYPGCKWRTHRPPTILSPDGIPWNKCMHLDGQRLSASAGIRLYHYSYVMPTQMRRKSEYYYARAPHRCIPDYFRRVYLPWVNGAITEVEEQFLGVHDWLPELRGPCMTKEFTDEHPALIQNAMGDLTQRFRNELEHESLRLQ